MSDGDINLTLEKREVVGKAVKHLRKDGQVPAVIHDHGKDSVHVMAAYLPMYKTFQQAGKHHPVNLTVDGKKYMAIIKDVDFEPKKHQLRHVVFNAIRQDQEVEAEIPVELEGEIPAERMGLMVLKNMDHIMVKALPKDLPDVITVNAEGLTEIGDKLTVADLKIPAGVTLMAEEEQPVAVVEESAAVVAARAEEEAAASAEETAEAEEEMQAEADKEVEGEEES